VLCTFALLGHRTQRAGAHWGQAAPGTARNWATVTRPMAMLDTACLTTTRRANLRIKRQAQLCWGAVRISLSLKSGLGLLARLDAPMSAAVRRGCCSCCCFAGNSLGDLFRVRSLSRLGSRASTQVAMPAALSRSDRDDPRSAASSGTRGAR
jgi:hypothetical protein